MSGYLFSPESPFLNSLFFGSDVGNSAVSPELRQIIAANQTRDAVRELGRLKLVSLYGQRASVDLQREGNRELAEIGDEMSGLGPEIGAGLNRGLRDVGRQIGRLSDGVQEGLERLDGGFRAGFDTMVDEVRDTGDAVRGLGMIQFASFVSQRESVALQRDANERLEQLTSGVDGLRHDVTTGFGQLTRGMQVGFDQISLDLQNGFQAVVKGLYHIDDRLGQKMLAGFAAVGRGDLPGAQDAFEAALSQTDTDSQRASRQKSMAALYLGRLAFDRQQYTEARRWFHQVYQHDDRLWNALVEGAASLLLDPTRVDRQADAKTVKQHFNEFDRDACETSGPDAYVLWYLLALTLAPLAPDLAVDAFQHGAHGDYRAKERDRPQIVSLLWELNPRTAGILLDLIRELFPWI